MRQRSRQLESGVLLVERESRERVLNACGFTTRYAQGLIRDRLWLVPLAERDRLNRSLLASARADVAHSEPDPTASSLKFLADRPLALNQPEEARTVLVRAIATAETEGESVSEAHMSLALAPQELGDLDAAGKAAEHALALCDVEHPVHPARRARFLRG